MSRKEVLVLFAKAPLPGQVKTRLIGTLSPEAATELYVNFLRDTFAVMQEVQDERESVSLVLCFTPADDIEAFEAADLDGCMLLAQSGADLGERLTNCFADLFQLGFTSIVIIGADAPTVPPEFLAEAFMQLESDATIVLGPATDGGFYLVGLSALPEKLFANIRWSSPSTLSDTLAQAESLHLLPYLLPSWDDVDTPEALQKLQTQLMEKEVSAHHTARFLKKLRKMADAK